MSVNTAYYKQLITGGSATALDGINGTSLSNLDIAYVMVSNILYVYQLDSTSGAAESSPDVIAPDTNAGDKRWLLQNSYTADGSIALAKLVEMATASFMGRTTAASGVPEILSKTQALAILNVEDGATVDQDLSGKQDVMGGDDNYVTDVEKAALHAKDGDSDLNATFKATLAKSGANIDITSILNAALKLGRDADNKIDFGTDNTLKIKVGGTEKAIVSISSGTGDNDKLVTQGYVDDEVSGATGDVATDTIWTAAGELAVGTGSNTAHKIAAGATTKLLVGGGAADPVWTEATGSDAPVRATSPTLVTPALGTPASGDLKNCDLSVPPAIGETTPDSIRGLNKEVYKVNTSPLTAVECSGTIVSNYGMTDAGCAITLPAAAEGLAFVCILPSVRAQYFRLNAGAGDKIYLNGVAGTDAEYIGVASGYATGTSVSMFCFKASDGSFDWFAIPLFGTWSADRKSVV